MENNLKDIGIDLRSYPTAEKEQRAEILSCIEEHQNGFNSAKQALDTLLADTTLSIASTPAVEEVHVATEPRTGVAAPDPGPLHHATLEGDLATARTEAYTVLGTSLETCHGKVTAIEEKREALTQRSQAYTAKLEQTREQIKTCTDEKEKQALETQAAAYEKAIGSIERALQIPERHEQIMQDLTNNPVTAAIAPDAQEQDIRNDTQFLLEITERVDAENAAYETLVADLRAVKELEAAHTTETPSASEEENDFPPPTA